MRNYKYFQKVFLKCSLFIKHLHFVPKQDTQCGKSKNSLEKYSVKSICCTILYENIVEKKTQIHSQMEKNREINLHYDLQMKRLISPISRNFCQKMVREEFSVKLI